MGATGSLGPKPITTTVPGCRDAVHLRQALAYVAEHRHLYRIVRQAEFVDETITLRAGDLLVSWVDHDWAHLRQMIGLLHAWLEDETAPYSTMYGGGSW